MRTHLVIELEPNVDPVTAAREFSKLPRVLSVLSIVDEQPMEVWRLGEHVASEHAHPFVQAQLRRYAEAEAEREKPVIGDWH